MKSVLNIRGRRTMLVRLLLPAMLIALSMGVVRAQTLGELDAVQQGQAQLDSASVTGGANTSYIGRAQDAAGAANANVALPPPTGTINNSAMGMDIQAPGGLPALPNAAPQMTPLTGYPGLSGPGTFGSAVPQPGAPGQATPTPLPTVPVLAGRKVTCAVCGSLLEDAEQIYVLESQLDKYADDGEMDNGIVGDGVRGNVEVLTDAYVGPECNSVKNRMINVVRNAEDLSVMQFFRYHVASVDPILAHRDMPKLLEKEEQRDEALRDWNNRFLADYRTNKNDPKSEFFQVYIPKPPRPPRYPAPPPGYVSPQDRDKPADLQGGAVSATGPNIYNGDAVIPVPGM